MLYVHIIKSIVFCMACLLLAQAVSAAQESNLEFNGKYIRLQTANEQLFTVYAAGPEQAKQGILLIHGWWGLNLEVEAWANQFAMAGYRVMAVDLYNCQVTTSAVKARKLMNEVKQSEANDKYAAAIKALSAPEREIAIIGRSYGASQALHAALVSQEKVSATIVYYPYGELISDRSILAEIKSPLLGHFARDDFFLTPDKVAQFVSTVKESGLEMTVNMYEAKHGFDKPTGKNFNEAAHKLAQDRTNQFLNKYLN